MVLLSKYLSFVPLVLFSLSLSAALHPDRINDLYQYQIDLPPLRISDRRASEGLMQG